MEITQLAKFKFLKFCAIFINMEKKDLEILINKGLTQREIAKESKVGQTTLRYWLNKLELKTKNEQKPRDKKHKCYVCGEEDKSLFYGNDKEVCSHCHNERVKKAGKEKRDYTIEKLGGKCISCGFKKYTCSLDVHHLDPKKKDVNFQSMRGWSLKRIDKEIKHCVLLCKNCHAAHHSGYIEL